MFQWILTQVFSLLGGPFAQAALKAYQAKLTAENSTEAVAAGLAAKELEVQSQIRIAEIGHWYEPDKICGYIFCAVLFKVAIWDNMFGLGSTDFHEGWLTTTLNMVGGFYFGQKTVVSATRILGRYFGGK